MATLYDQLLNIVTVTEDGNHFTEAFPGWPELETRGLIEVERPSGTEEEPLLWYVSLTQAGVDVLDSGELI